MSISSGQGKSVDNPRLPGSTVESYRAPKIFIIIDSGKGNLIGDGHDTQKAPGSRSRTRLIIPGNVHFGARQE
jgi:hypothetical protein